MLPDETAKTALWSIFCGDGPPFLNGISMKKVRDELVAGLANKIEVTVGTDTFRMARHSIGVGDESTVLWNVVTAWKTVKSKDDVRRWVEGCMMDMVSRAALINVLRTWLGDKCTLRLSTDNSQVDKLLNSLHVTGDNRRRTKTKLKRIADRARGLMRIIPKKTPNPVAERNVMPAVGYVSESLFTNQCYDGGKDNFIVDYSKRDFDQAILSHTITKYTKCIGVEIMSAGPTWYKVIDRSLRNSRKVGLRQRYQEKNNLNNPDRYHTVCALVIADNYNMNALCKGMSIFLSNIVRQRTTDKQVQMLRDPANDSKDGVMDAYSGFLAMEPEVPFSPTNFCNLLETTEKPQTTYRVDPYKRRGVSAAVYDIDASVSMGFQNTWYVMVVGDLTVCGCVRDGDGGVEMLILPMSTPKRSSHSKQYRAETTQNIDRLLNEWEKILETTTY
jgi:hypothetical protein